MAAPDIGDKSGPPAESEQDAIAARREARIQRHPRMRSLIAWLSAAEFGSQNQFAERIGVRALTISQYNTGLRNGRALNAGALDHIHRELEFGLQKAQLPLSIPANTAPPPPPPVVATAATITKSAPVL